MFEKDKIYISRTDDRGRIWLWKCSRNGRDRKLKHRKLIEKDGTIEYKFYRGEDYHGWENNILATEEEANWLEQCILNPKLNGCNIDDILKLNQEINYEIY